MSPRRPRAMPRARQPSLVVHLAVVVTSSWVSQLYKKRQANFQFSWRTFHEDSPPSDVVADVPQDFFFLRHDAYRRKCVKEACGKFKTLYDTRHTLAAYSHQAILCYGPCRKIYVSSHQAYIAHYRRNSSSVDRRSPNSFETETFLHQFKADIMKSVLEAKRRIK
ncbi:uncharacterized protein LOC108669386 [Hyalella azteca]|uniref:Uncharacterized protein LOC108669386 n=1 Tax=Hyalella azteca TaxID=294128 RepID=A0A979FNN3_HYAAZ|nr:uncharacterized protein LOC108669386 [Hyalella azteca]